MRRALLLAVSLIAGCGLPLAGLGASGDTTPEGGASVEASVDSATGDDDAALDTASGPPADVASSEGAAGDAGATTDAGADGPGTSNDPGDALQFSGAAYVAIGQLPIPGDFTLEAWVHPASTSGETSILAEDRNGQGAGQFRFGIASGKLFFIMSDATGNNGGLYTGTGYALESPASLPLATWTHVAVAKLGTAFTLFVNGTQVAQFTTTGAPLVYGGPAVAFRIAARVGSDGTSADEAYDGIIDEVRVWNIARSGTEIAANMSQTVSPSDTGLLAYWRFDEGTGTAASDEENHYPGTLVDGPEWVVSTAF